MKARKRQDDIFLKILLIKNFVYGLGKTIL